MANSTSLRAPMGGEPLEGFSSDFLRHLLGAARGVKSLAKGPDECLVARAQLVQREVDRLQAEAVTALEDSLATAEALSEDARRDDAHVSGHERSQTAVEVLDALSDLVTHLRELDSFFAPHDLGGLAGLNGRQAHLDRCVTARLSVLLASLRLTEDGLEKLDLMDEARALRELKAASFTACEKARRVLCIDQELESWCSM